MEALCSKFPLLHHVHSCFSVLEVLLLIRQGVTLVPMGGFVMGGFVPKGLMLLITEGHFSYAVVQTVLGLATSWSSLREGRKKVEREGRYSGII